MDSLGAGVEPWMPLNTIRRKSIFIGLYIYGKMFHSCSLLKGFPIPSGDSGWKRLCIANTVRGALQD